MRIFDDDDPLVLDGTYDIEGYKPGERARIAKQRARIAKQRKEQRPMDHAGWKVEPTEELALLGPPFVINEHGLTLRGPDPTLDQCGRGLRQLKHVHDCVKYWLGQLMNLTEGLFAEEASQVVDHELLTEQEASAYRFVAKSVAPSVYERAPSWDHARVVAKLPAEKQTEWLDRARAETWSARKLGTEVALASASDGKTVMRWWLVIEAQTEAKRDKLAERLEAEGFTVKRQEKLKKVAKPKRAKKGPVTARKKRKGLPKMNTRKRVPAMEHCGISEQDLADRWG